MKQNCSHLGEVTVISTTLRQLRSFCPIRHLCLQYARGRVATAPLPVMMVLACMPKNWKPGTPLKTLALTKSLQVAVCGPDLLPGLSEPAPPCLTTKPYVSTINLTAPPASTKDLSPASTPPLILQTAAFTRRLLI